MVENRRKIAINRGQKDPKTQENEQLWAAIASMVDTKTTELRRNYARLESKVDSILVILADIRSSVQLVDVGGGSTKSKLDELIENLAMSLSNLDHIPVADTVRANEIITGEGLEALATMIGENILPEHLAALRQLRREDDTLDTEGDSIIENLSDIDDITPSRTARNRRQR